MGSLETDDVDIQWQGIARNRIHTHTHTPIKKWSPEWEVKKQERIRTFEDIQIGRTLRGRENE